ncbi:OLC1v1011620C1 [Oldenlandia corymbosa var. corymbosa]|uniref:OLC1v1011620C1 n=1 Tax=Oldenlandia corymbosa var. corymbosa TaxID=529605 RepID=A0AAV1DX34_OLDCO|nr:OLC1v1011620C1 [Oldenlandia corymbosa var. corymbosa]
MAAEHPVKAFGWAARDPSGHLSPFNFSRRATGEHDVQFKVLYCGICHSDLHMIKNEFGYSQYPMVPGHEIVGVATEVGSKVTKVKVGDKVGVGCVVESCRSCEMCTQDLENYCSNFTMTFNSKHPDGSITYGGYSDLMVCDEHYVLRWPENLPLDAGAPLLCAGITTYSPLRHFGLDKPGTHVGVVGLGGLGHVAVKFAKAFGAKVTVISTSESKKKEALEKLGADAFLVSTDPEQMQAAAGTMNGILDTVSAVHPIMPLINLVKSQGKVIMLGAPNKPVELHTVALLMGRKSVTGNVEVIKMDYLNTAMERLSKGDVRYRFVIDRTLSKIKQEKLPVEAFGWAARDSSGHLSPFNFSRRATGEKDVQFKVLYCGICHSDLAMIKNEWGFAQYPLVPGHELVGVVTEVGSKVTKVKVGDKVGVGCLADSCRSCDMCAQDLENYCPSPTFSYGSPQSDGTLTYGGYSDIMVCDEHFVLRWPEKLPIDAGAPLLCAGITTYSPLRHFGLDKPGTHVGVVGLGGLGHVAVKFAKAFGAKVTVISTSESKKEEAIEKLGADAFLVSKDPEQMQGAAGTMDGIIDTVSAPHPIMPLINLVKTQGKVILIGVPEKPLELHSFGIIAGRKTVSGSYIGGIKETQEMLDFAAEHNVVPDVELIKMDYVNTAMERLARSDVRYRFVIDIANSFSKST